MGMAGLALFGGGEGCVFSLTETLRKNSGHATEVRSGLFEEEHWVRYIENLPSSQWRAIFWAKVYRVVL